MACVHAWWSMVRSSLIHSGGAMQDSSFGDGGSGDGLYGSRSPVAMRNSTLSCCAGVVGMPWSSRGWSVRLMLTLRSSGGCVVLASFPVFRGGSRRRWRDVFIDSISLWRWCVDGLTGPGWSGGPSLVDPLDREIFMPSSAAANYCNTKYAEQSSSGEISRFLAVWASCRS